MYTVFLALGFVYSTSFEWPIYVDDCTKKWKINNPISFLPLKDFSS